MTFTLESYAVRPLPSDNRGRSSIRIVCGGAPTESEKPEHWRRYEQFPPQLLAARSFQSRQSAAHSPHRRAIHKIPRRASGKRATFQASPPWLALSGTALDVTGASQSPASVATSNQALPTATTTAAATSVNTASSVSTTTSAAPLQVLGNLPSVISGTVFLDLNDNGVQDSGETGVTGATITLTGTQANGTSVSESVNTAADGTYAFSGVLPGTYSINESVPTGFVAKAAIAAPNKYGYVHGTVQDSTDIGNIQIEGCGCPVVGNFTEATIPTPPPPPPQATDSIGGTVYSDTNANGTFDTGDTTISGVVITATGTDAHSNAVSQSTTTDANGQYQFANLQPGQYVLTETPPSGYLIGNDNAGTPFGGTASTSNGQETITGIVIPSSTTPVAGTKLQLRPLRCVDLRKHLRRLQCQWRLGLRRKPCDGARDGHADRNRQHRRGSESERPDDERTVSVQLGAAGHLLAEYLAAVRIYGRGKQRRHPIRRHVVCCGHHLQYCRRGSGYWR